MVNILIVNDNYDEALLLQKEFEAIDDTVYHSNLDNALEIYESVSPDLVVMNFTNNPGKAFDMSNRITEFDNTACIFALAEPNRRADTYTSGVRGVVTYNPVNTAEDAHHLFEKLTNACNELTNDTCIACWKTRRFANLDMAA